MTAALVLAMLAQAPSAPDVDAAIKAFEEAIRNASDDAKVAAAKEALKTRHERVVRAVGRLLQGGTERVRIGAALALGDADHPVSVDVLVAALAAHQKQPPVLAAIARSLGRLGWEKAAAPLNDLVKNVAHEEIRTAMPEILAAVGAIGSASSVDPLIDLLVKLQNGGRRDPWPNTRELVGAASAALRAITGGDAGRFDEWRLWWRVNRELLVAQARNVYWVRGTQERTTLERGARAPEDSVLVAMRLVESAPVEAAPEGRRKRDGK